MGARERWFLGVETIFHEAKTTQLIFALSLLIFFVLLYTCFVFDTSLISKIVFSFSSFPYLGALTTIFS